MSQSGAPGETRKLPSNWARLTIQMDVGFTPTGMDKLAPQWNKTALAALRKLLESQSIETVTFGLMKEFLKYTDLADQVYLDNISATVGR